MDNKRRVMGAPSRRRDFLKLSGLLGLCCAAGGIPGLGVAAGGIPGLGVAAAQSPLQEAGRSFTLSGQPLLVTLYARDPERAFHEAFEEMKRVACLVDPQQPASPMAALCRDGRARGLDEDTADALAQADRVLSVLREAGPGPKDSFGCLEGMASGYVLDAGALCLRKRGVRNALLSWRGAFRAIGGRPEGRAWEIFPGHGRSLALPKDGAASLASVGTDLHKGAVSRVLVLGPNAACAGALARGTLALDVRAALALYDGLPGVECLIGTEEGGFLSSKGLGRGRA